ncbi:hypothetical protein F5I97DRAFT_1807787 [Phlebopus sp. FC_14]|nr:hypothetical protein F5I97DRAFT_1807787 [Phlebopus sp. FC_14]
MQRAIGIAITSLLEGNGWQKLSNPSVGRGATALPKKPSDVVRIGLRLDYDSFIERGEGEEKVKWHRYKLQVNAGDSIPNAFKGWRNKQKKGTHAVMATVEIRDGAGKDEITAVLKEATKDVEGV